MTDKPEAFAEACQAKGAFRGVRLDDQPRDKIELVWAMAQVIRASYPVTVSPYADTHGEGQRGVFVNFDAEQAAQALVDAGYGKIGGG